MTDPFWCLDCRVFFPFLAMAAAFLAIVLATVRRFKRVSWVLWTVLIASGIFAAGVKTLALLRWEGPSLWRQLIVIGALAGALAAALGKDRLDAYARLCGLWSASPVPKSPKSPEKRIMGRRWQRVLMGALAVTAAGLALIVPKGSSRVASILCLAVGCAFYGCLVILELRRRSEHLKDPAHAPAPERRVLWTVSLPWVGLSLASIVAIVIREPVASSSIPAADLSELLVVTAIGEEFIFRGLLLGLALIATRPGRVRGGRDRTGLGYWIVSLSFGLWHVGDAILTGQRRSWEVGAIVLYATGTVLLMTIVSRAILIPLRIRTGTIAAPVLAHLAANAPGIVLGEVMIP